MLFQAAPRNASNVGMIQASQKLNKIVRVPPSIACQDIVIQLPIRRVMAEKWLKEIVTMGNSVQMLLKHAERKLKSLVSNHALEHAAPQIIVTTVE